MSRNLRPSRAVTRPRKNLVISLAGILLGTIYCTEAQAQTAINANDRGWYNNSGSHNPGNNNTYTGTYFNLVYRSYYRFTIPATFDCVQSARLELELENYYGNGTPHTINLYDVAAANVPLLDTQNGSGNGVNIQIDLGTGTPYGTQGGLTGANVGNILSFNLPAAALADIEAAAGSDFAVGADTIPSNPSTFYGLRFSAGNEQRVHRLTLTACPIAPDLKAKKSVEVYDPQNLGLYNLPGNDVIYTITVANEGAGSVDTDTMELIDAIPSEITFYNGDIDDGGPETDAVAFIDTGSGLTWNYGTDVRFATGATPPANFAACNHPPGGGYDSSVTFICINPKGVMTAGTPSPQFSVQFRARLN